MNNMDVYLSLVLLPVVIFLFYAIISKKILRDKRDDEDKVAESKLKKSKKKTYAKNFAETNHEQKLMEAPIDLGNSDRNSGPLF